jgi:hypothetical protein
MNFFLYFIIISIFIIRINNFPKLLDGFKCYEKKPLTIKFKDINILNYKDIISNNKIFLLYVTATWCDFCCQETYILQKFKDIIKYDNEIIIKNIQIYNLISDKNLDVLKINNIALFKIPSLYLFYHDKFIQYSSYFKEYNILLFIRKIIHPIKKLINEKEINSFMDNPQFKIKVIGFFHDKKEYKDELQKFKKYSKLISYRNDLSIGYNTNKTLIKILKEKKLGIWFDTYSLNSIVLRRYDKYYFLDLSLKSIYIYDFLYYNTISSIDELSHNNKDLINKLVTPIALFFIDTAFNLKNYHKVLNYLIELSKDFDLQYIFMFMDGGAKSKTKTDLGLEDDYPTLVIHFLEQKKIYKFPKKSKEFNDKNIREFLINTRKVYLDLNGKFNKDKNEEINKKYLNNLSKTQILTSLNFNDIIMNQKKKVDIVLFNINLDIEDEKTLILTNIIKDIIEKFNFFNVNSISFCIINNSKKQNQNIRIFLNDNKIILFRKDNKEIIYSEKVISVYRLMKWIEKNSSVKFVLPDFPHIKYEELEHYLEEKNKLEENINYNNKTDFEIDDIISVNTDL